MLERTIRVKARTTARLEHLLRRRLAPGWYHVVVTRLTKRQTRRVEKNPPPPRAV